MRLRALRQLLIVLAVPLAAQAQFNYATNNGTITILQYTGPGGDVVIPDTLNGLKVTSVGSQAFFQANSMTSLTLGTNVTTIQPNAVFQCPALAMVNIPQSVTNIGDGPFVDCKGLTTITLPGSNPFYAVTNGALFNKSQRDLIEYPGGLGGSYTISSLVTNVGEAFIGNSLNSILVDPANVVYAGTNGVLFSKDFTQLIAYPGTAPGSYTVPKTVRTVVSASFEFSTGVTTVTMGTNVTSIGSFALYDCSALTSITVNSNNAYYTTAGGVLYDKAKTVLIQYPSGLPGAFVVPDTVFNIGDGAFGDAFGLTNITLASGVTNIGVEAFYSCINLSSATLGNNLKTIQQAAFFYCPALRSVVLPPTLTSLGFEAFAGCQNLTNACFEGNAPADMGSVFFFDTSLTQILHVNGTTGWGATYDGILTAPCTSCGGIAPVLQIAEAAADSVVIAWPSSLAGYTLQSTANPAAGSWSPVLPSPVVAGGLFVVTNQASAGARFYRLAH
ncbi:MAG TPA: leucine-rich repeat domain-containing protein [Verrucomicrobiae bacterium]|nr:leucine-rich repeat domain-containing protein [Verrucomicrobiae bacterium]